MSTIITSGVGDGVLDIDGVTVLETLTLRVGVLLSEGDGGCGEVWVKGGGVEGNDGKDGGVEGEPRHGLGGD